MADYNDQNKDQLLDLARERGLEGYSQLNKPELVQLLENDDANRGPDNSELKANKDVSEEVQKEYQEDYVPERRKEVEAARKEGFDIESPGYQSEASDPDNPVVEAKLGEDEEYQQLSDEEKELADLALDASGPLNVQSPYGRVTTGAVSEEQAKQQEEERAKLPEEYVGDVPERVTDEQVEWAERTLDPEKQTEYELEAHNRANNVDGPSLNDQYAALEDRKNRLHERDVNVLATAEAAEDQNIHETVGHEGQPQDYTRIFQQRTQLDTTGLGGPGANRIDKAYRTPAIRSGIFHQAFNTERPRDAEIVQAEKDRQAQSNPDE